MLASCREAGLDADATSRIIITSNRRYLAISVVTVAIISVAMFLVGHDLANGPTSLPWPIRMVWARFLWSRATEVLVAFYCDAFDKLLPTIISASALTWSQRVWLALSSYGELVINFVLGYALLPVCEWQTKAQPSNIGDILFYSASTITTSGGGGFVPQGARAEVPHDLRGPLRADAARSLLRDLRGAGDRFRRAPVRT